MLRLEGIRAGHGAIEVLKGITLTVDQGEVVTLIGANGAGKTTTLMTACGILRPRAGRISFLGQDITGKPAHEIVRLGLVVAPEGRRIFSRLSVLENLEMGAFTRPADAAMLGDIERVFVLFPVLKERMRQPGGTLSGGEQQMLAIGRALMTRPKLLLLDEPSLGLAPIIVARIFEVLRDLNREGVTVLLVEQNARMALKLAHRGYVMETGAITAEGPASQLLEDPKVRAAYLGE